MSQYRISQAGLEVVQSKECDGTDVILGDGLEVLDYKLEPDIEYGKGSVVKQGKSSGWKMRKCRLSKRVWMFVAVCGVLLVAIITLVIVEIKLGNLENGMGHKHNQG